VAKVTADKPQLSNEDTYTNDVGGGAVLDNNEVVGVECEEAYNSLLKGKQWANNKVYYILSLLHRSLIFCRALLLLNAMRSLNLPSISKFLT
jgi:hypothetical protein